MVVVKNTEELSDSRIRQLDAETLDKLHKLVLTEDIITSQHIGDFTSLFLVNSSHFLEPSDQSLQRTAFHLRLVAETVKIDIGFQLRLFGLFRDLSHDLDTFFQLLLFPESFLLIFLVVLFLLQLLFLQ
jgi:hypothetical protein